MRVKLPRGALRVAVQVLLAAALAAGVLSHEAAEAARLLVGSLGL